MKFIRRLISPLFAFIAIQLVWIALVAFWISWFFGSHRKLRDLAEKYSPGGLPSGADWVILAEGLLMLLALLAGVYVIFLFWRRQATLYRAQKDFIAQVTHELKSPLASLQLHLETVRRRRPTGQRMDVFLDTMLADTDRLGNLIDNLLAANRLEQKSPRLSRQPTNLSDLVTGYFRPRQYGLPRAGNMTLEVEPGLLANIEAEALETAFRNLVENAVLYSVGPPVLTVRLQREGSNAHLSVIDQGRGIDPKDRKKVFHMFYRARRRGETIRGSGLGLFIVKAVVKLHGGKVWLESDGPDRGSTFHILLPLLPEGFTEEAP